MYAEARTAGFVHEAALRRELTAQLGVEWTSVHNGIADIDGVSTEVLDAFSRRSREIDDQVQAWGADTAAARQSAAVQTRKAKDYDVTPDQLAPEWRRRAERLGLARPAIRRLLDRVTPTPLDRSAWRSILNELAGRQGLTAQLISIATTSSERRGARRGATLNEIDACADAFLADQRTVALAGAAANRRQDIIRLRDGRVVRALGDAPRFSTRSVLAAERQVIELALQRRGDRCGVADPSTIEAALTSRPSMGPDQAEMVRRITAGGAGVDDVVGPAGTGKTFALDAAREAWQAAGFQVVGAAIARVAARNLQESAGIESTSVASLLEDLRRGGAFGLSSRTVVVVDEAAMLGTHQMAELIDRASTARAKMVLVGDHRQLPEIDAGGTFSALANRLDPFSSRRTVANSIQPID